MLLLDHFERLTVSLSREDAGNVVTEVRGCDAELTVKDLLIFVDRVDFDSLLHELSAAIEHFCVQLFLFLLKTGFLSFNQNISEVFLVRDLLLSRLATLSGCQRSCGCPVLFLLLDLHLAEASHLFLQLSEDALILLVYS